VTAAGDGPASDPRRGAIAASLAAILFGSAYVATAFAIRSFEPIPAAFWRSALGAVAIGAWLLVSRRVVASPGCGSRAGPVGGVDRSARLARLFVLGLLGGLVFLGAMNLAVAGVGATITSFVAGLYAVLGAVLAWPVLAERLTAPAVGGFAVALLGTVLLAEVDPARASTGGLVAGLVAAVTYAVFLVLSRRWSSRYGLGPMTISFANNAIATVGFLAIVLAGGPGALVPATVRGDALAALLWLGLLAIVAQALVVDGVRNLRADRASAFLLLNPITATILAVTLLGERLSSTQAVGGLLVLVGMALATGTLDLLRDLLRRGGRPVRAER